MTALTPRQRYDLNAVQELRQWRYDVCAALARILGQMDIQPKHVVSEINYVGSLLIIACPRCDEEGLHETNIDGADVMVLCNHMEIEDLPPKEPA